jgi:hypothetical protein
MIGLSVCRLNILLADLLSWAKSQSTTRIPSRGRAEAARVVAVAATAVPNSSSEDEGPSRRLLPRCWPRRGTKSSPTTPGPKCNRNSTPADARPLLQMPPRWIHPCSSASDCPLQALGH